MSTTAVPDLDPVAERLLEESRRRPGEELRGRERLTRWLAAGTVLALAIPLALLAPGTTKPDLLVLAALVGSFALASHVQFEVASGFCVPTELVLVPMLFLLPPQLVPLLVAAGFTLAWLPQYLRKTAPLGRIAVPIGNAWFAFGPALVVLAFGVPATGLAQCGLLVLILAAQFSFDLVGSISGERLALGVPPRALLGPLAWVFAVDACLAPIGLAVAQAATVTRVAVLMPLPLLVLLRLFSREREQRLGHQLELSHAYRGTALLLGDVVEADDAYTGTHSREVVDLVLEVCDRLGLNERERRKAEFAALLHDVGKIKVASEIINKPGPLTPEERAVINTHTIEGQNLLTPIGGLLAEVGTIVRSCHEHYDGNGYPDQLAGEAIPLVARIVCACDAFNAMTTDRSYRKGRSADAALAELQANRGTQFDPKVVDAIALVVASKARVAAHVHVPIAS